jgi:hypothetical protein
LSLGEDAFFNTRVDLATEEVTAPLVFAGYGLRIPEKSFDDFAGLDLHGKIVVYLAGSPADVPGALASHYQTPAERWKVLKAAGAVGIVAIPNPASMDIPWSRMSLNRAHPSMDLAGSEFNETAGLKMALTFNFAQAEKLFAGSGHTFAEIAELGKDRKPLPRFALATSLKAHASVKRSEVERPASSLAFWARTLRSRVRSSSCPRTSRPTLAASGRATGGSPAEKPRRSILFTFVTAEEKGLLGSLRLFSRYSGEPLEEFFQACAGFEILEERSDGNARAAEDPVTAHSVRGAFDCGALRPVQHEDNPTRSGRQDLRGKSGRRRVAGGSRTSR